jgi:Outer membrane protein beta-barrel domain
MVTFFKSIASIGLCTISATVVAQQSPAVQHPWSIGLQATVQRYAVFYPYSGQKELSILPAQFTLGYQLSPRLGLQAGLAYRKETGWNQMLPNYSGTTERNDPGFRSFALPLLLRYSLGYNAEKRLIGQLLGGITLLHSSRTITQRTVSTGETVQLSDQMSTAQFSFGAGLRYGFSPRLSGNLDFLLNRALDRKVNEGRWLALYTAGLGISYHF